MRKLIAIAAVAATMSTAAIAQERNCMSTDALIEAVQQHKDEHVVLRGDSLDAFVKALLELGAPLDDFVPPEYAIVIFQEARGKAFVVWGTGTEVCNPLPMPFGLARSLLRAA